MLGLSLCDLRPPGEILGVRKIDLEIDNGLLWVRGQVRCERDLEGKYRRVYKDRTKTGFKDPRRIEAIPIPDLALPLITATLHINSEFVVPTSRQSPFKARRTEGANAPKNCDVQVGQAIKGGWT